MKATNRSALILVAVVVAAIALAVVVMSRSDESASTALGVYGSDGGSAGYLAADEGVDESGDNGALIVLDPAKTEPLLDKFHSKDPFKQLYTEAVAGGGTGGSSPAPAGSPTPTGSPTTTQKIAGANIRINEDIFQKAQEGDKLPNANNGPFQVLDVTSTGVKFKLLGGYVIGTDQTTFVANLKEPTEVTLVDPDTSAEKTYTINVLQIVYEVVGTSGGTGGSGSGGGSGTSSGSTVTQGQHTIKVVSIDTQNGVPSCTLVVDGVTYANKQVGDTFSTGWGQIKILGINVGAQTVTILHGDVRITLHVGQSVAK